MENKIAYEDWVKDIDLIAKIPTRNKKYTLTNEQEKIIHYARDRNNPVSWGKLSKYFNDTFGIKIARTTLREYYEDFKGEI